MLRAIFTNGKKFLIRPQSDILSATAVMMVILIVTKFIGMLVKTIAVSQLGTEKYGLFIAANTLPETLSMILIFGSITSVIIPTFVDEIRNYKRERFVVLFSSLVNAGLFVFCIIAVGVIITADSIIPILVEQISKPVDPYTPEQIAQIVAMMRWLMLPQLILGVSSFISSVLNAYKHFIVPQLAPLFYNLGVLFGAAFLIPAFNFTAWGLTAGMLLGSFLHLLVQVPLSIRLGISYRPVIDVANKKLRSLIRVGCPRIIALSTDQIAILIDRVIAMGLGAMSLGAYYLAISLVTIPYSLFSTTFAIAAFPHLSSRFLKGDIDGFKSLFSKVFGQILFCTTPVTMVLLVLRLPLVRLFYGILGREFTWEATLMVAWVVFFFSLGLIPEVLISFLYRAFYAAGDTIRPLVVASFIVIGGVVTGILFTNYFSHFDTFSLKSLFWDTSFFFSKAEGVAAIGGLALSSSLVYSMGFLVLIYSFLRKFGNLSKKRFWLSSVKKLFSGFIMAILMYILFKLWDEVLDTARTINILILTFSTIIPGLCVYLWLCFLTREPEIKTLYKIFRAARKILHKT